MWVKSSFPLLLFWIQTRKNRYKDLGRYPCCWYLGKWVSCPKSRDSSKVLAMAARLVDTAPASFKGGLSQWYLGTSTPRVGVGTGNRGSSFCRLPSQADQSSWTRKPPTPISKQKQFTFSFFWKAKRILPGQYRCQGCRLGSLKGWCLVKRQWRHVTVQPSPSSHRMACGCEVKWQLHNHS